MTKICLCGESMDIELRTVVFQQVVAIENVPVCICEGCDRQEVLPAIKEEITELIRVIGANPERSTIYFNEECELAHLLIQACKQELMASTIGQLIRERINELLDLMLLAKSLDDAQWLTDLERRLSQISKYGKLSSMASK